MGILVYVLGRSGTGKSYSMRNFKKNELGVVNVQGKILPFKGSNQLDILNTDDPAKIVKGIAAIGKCYKRVVVDDFQYVMANEFMRRATEKGYDKFTEIARHAWDIANCVRELPDDVIVYIMCHTDTDQDGFEKLKTIGKMLDEKIVLEGMSTIVLKTAVSDGQYFFLTQNNGKDTVKSPAGMFPSYAIDNDLKYVDEKIRNYYEIGDYLSDEDLTEMDEAVKHEEIPIKEEKKRGRTRGKEKKEEPTEAPKEEAKEETPKRKRAKNGISNDIGTNKGNDGNDGAAEETPKRRRRSTIKEENEAAIAEARAEYLNKADELNAGKGEKIPMEEYETPEAELPKRKRRKKAQEPENAESDSNDSENAENEDVTTTDENKEEAATPKRRRRRSS